MAGKYIKLTNIEGPFCTVRDTLGNIIGHIMPIKLPLGKERRFAFLEGCYYKAGELFEIAEELKTYNMDKHIERGVRG